MKNKNNQLVLGFNIDGFNEDIKQMRENLTSLVYLGIIKIGETDLLANRISESMSKYITIARVI